MTKYYKNTVNDLFVNPVVANHSGLKEITEKEFDEILKDKNKPIPVRRVDLDNLYDQAMQTLQGSYPQSEVNTFTRKLLAARSYISDATACDDSDKYLLAQLAGVVSSKRPVVEADFVSELAGISTSDWASVSARAVKIINASSRFDYYLARIEFLRDTAREQLAGNDDCEAVVASLEAALENMWREEI